MIVCAFMVLSKPGLSLRVEETGAQPTLFHSGRLVRVRPGPNFLAEKPVPGHALLVADWSRLEDM